MSCNSVAVWGVSPLHWPWKQEKEWQEDVYDIIRHPATLLYTYTTHCCIEKLLSVPPPAPVSKICQQIGCSCATGLATSCLVWKLSVVWPWPWADLVTSTYLWSIVTIRLEAECDHPLLAFSWHIYSQFCLEKTVASSGDSRQISIV